jgi:hypothetical protein
MTAIPFTRFHFARIVGKLWNLSSQKAVYPVHKRLEVHKTMSGSVPPLAPPEKPPIGEHRQWLFLPQLDPIPVPDL